MPHSSQVWVEANTTLLIILNILWCRHHHDNLQYWRGWNMSFQFPELDDNVLLHFTLLIEDGLAIPMSSLLFSLFFNPSATPRLLVLVVTAAWDLRVTSLRRCRQSMRARLALPFPVPSSPHNHLIGLFVLQNRFYNKARTEAYPLSRPSQSRFGNG